ncbi:YD repeat-containing protein [Algoriphagus locisalis]|uniref:YD repeat-containing protein n=1 Tax=Algoriphagus locisalis TaxID=305507 RepID=A0A1I7CCK6_9BACT|nr:RHS repeat domain-containing protein [Algoriphagus locisalis]SFT97145.1 YD repeat-containing protein [Algoriphagus locisalis]
MRKLFSASFVLLLSLNSLNLFGQIYKPEFVPPSPNSYGLAKYGDVPVNLYNGLPDISIPVCTMREGNLSLDISLSYHGSGIKVDEVASWVGLGWSLNAGGVIVRKVRGRAEYLSSSGVLLPQRANIGFFSLSQGITRAQFIQQNNLDAAANNSIDTEPDEYIFNFNGRSGSFVFDSNGNVKLSQADDIRVELQYVSGFDFNIIITTEDGNIYEFSSYEKTYFTGINQMHITAWYITKIKSPTGSEIIFEYQSTPSVSHDIRQYSEYVVELTTTPTIIPALTPVTGVSVTEMRVKKIITSSGWVEFTTSSQQRLDYKTSSYPLNLITIYNADGSISKRMNLYTSHFEANNANKYNGSNPSVYQHLNYRLRLDSLQQFSSAGIEIGQPYKFEYWGDNNPVTNDVYTLPYRLSPKQDHWGYFNNSSNQHIFPGNSDGRSIGSDRWYVEFAEYSDIYVTTTIGNGANREPSAEPVKANSLKTVYYPTGGSKEFQFESNVFTGASGVGDGLRIGKIIDHFGNNETKETNFIYDYRLLTSDPRDLYYKYFTIKYRGSDTSPLLGSELLSHFGLPPGNSPFLERGYIKISTSPQAILGGGSEFGYGSVKVVQPGNGYVINEFDNNLLFPDYNGIDDIYDDIDMFHMDNLFNSEHITSIVSPETPQGANLQKTISVLDAPYPVSYSNSWKRGRLKSRSTYNELGKILKKEKFDYERTLLSVTPGYKIFGWSASQEFIYSRYYVPNALIRIKSQIVEDYNTTGLNPFVTTTTYAYDNPLHFQTTKTIVEKSDGAKEITNVSYPSDYPSGSTFIDNLKTKNLLSYPIETVRYNEVGTVRTIVSGVINKYKTGGAGLIDEVLNLEVQNPISLSSFKFSNRSNGVLPPSGSSTGFLPDSKYSLRVLGELYDLKGNIQQLKNKEGTSTSYLWSYNYQFPIAEAVNATLSQIAFTSFETTDKGGWSYSGAPITTYKTGKKGYNLSSGSVTKTGITASTASPYRVGFWAKTVSGTASVNVGGQTESLSTAWKWVEKNITSTSLTISGSNIIIDELRLHPLDAMMTSYTYEALVGMTSQTDPRGYTLIYEYDTANRLKTIKDEDGNIVEHYEYNYGTGN